MKNRNILSNSFLIITVLFAIVSCKKNNGPVSPADGSPVYYDQVSQAGMPLINTIYISPADQANYAATPPGAMAAAFTTEIQTNLLALNPSFSTNTLGYNSSVYSSFLATGTLPVVITSLTGSGTTTLSTFTGRNLNDDAADIQLKLLYGGAAGTSNPALIKDNVNANDKATSTSFPYLASPW